MRIAYGLTLGLALLGLLGGPCQALEIRLDYSLDTNDFFKTKGSPQRAAIRAVADYYEKLITDRLSEINPETYGQDVYWSAEILHPATKAPHFIKDLVVPTDTIIVYVGGQDQTGSLAWAGRGQTSYIGPNQAWQDLISARGETNADGSPAYGDGATDFGGWGGSISFNTEQRWNYSLTRRIPDGRLGRDFVSTALHEIGHVLGFGQSDSWRTYLDTDAEGTAVFLGPHSVAEFGGPVPRSPTSGHWQEDGFCVPWFSFDPDNPLNVLSKTINHFGDPGGRDQIVLMNPSTCSSSGVLLRVLTRLDLAGFRDLGWTLRGDPISRAAVEDFEVIPVSQGTELTWFGQPGKAYVIEWCERLEIDWEPLIDSQQGVGRRIRVIDTTPMAQRFYRLVVEQR